MKPKSEPEITVNIIKRYSKTKFEIPVPPKVGALCIPVVAQFDPDNLFVVRLLSGPAVTAGPRAVPHLHLQTLRVEGRWA